MIQTINGSVDTTRATCTAEAHVCAKQPAAGLGTYRTPSLFGRFRPSSVVTG